MSRAVHFIALLSYLNILCFEVKYCYMQNFQAVGFGETLIEVVLEDVLDLKQHDNLESIPEIMFDEYRILTLAFGLLPLVFYFSRYFRRIISTNQQIKHIIYYIKRLILPGYYTFLYRYRPF